MRDINLYICINRCTLSECLNFFLNSVHFIIGPAQPLIRRRLNHLPAFLFRGIMSSSLGEQDGRIMSLIVIKECSHKLRNHLYSDFAVKASALMFCVRCLASLCHRPRGIGILILSHSQLVPQTIVKEGVWHHDLLLKVVRLREIHVGS